MNTVEYIKSEIKRIYETNPNIHISVKLTRPRLTIEGAPVTIVGVYKNIFQIEESDKGRTNSHAFQYGDVLTGQVVIEELDYVPMTSLLNKKQG